MQISHPRWRGVREMCEDVRFALRQPVHAQIIEIKPDAVCRTVNWMNKTQWHQRETVSGRAQPTNPELCR
jgi:hypothetical protein